MTAFVLAVGSARAQDTQYELQQLQNQVLFAVGGPTPLSYNRSADAVMKPSTSDASFGRQLVLRS
jgi:hypothetical protein